MSLGDGPAQPNDLYGYVPRLPPAEQSLSRLLAGFLRRAYLENCPVSRWFVVVFFTAKRKHSNAALCRPQDTVPLSSIHLPLRFCQPWRVCCDCCGCCSSIYRIASIPTRAALSAPHLSLCNLAVSYRLLTDWSVFMEGVWVLATAGKPHSTSRGLARATASLARFLEAVSNEHVSPFAVPS